MTWIVVVNFGSHALLEQNFASHLPGAGPLGGLVVVDNFSTVAEQGAMARICQLRGWMFVSRPTNDGFGAACNAGIAAARDRGARSVILVNPDAVVPSAVVDQLAAQLEREPLTVVAPMIVTSDGLPYFRGSRVDLRNGHMRSRVWDEEPPGPDYLTSQWPQRDWLTGACLGFSLRLWELTGGFDEAYFLYWEDVDFSQRCVEAGARLCLRRDLVVVHDEGATHGQQGSRARSPIYYYYNCRNRLLYATRHLGRRELWRWVRSTPAESWQILLRGGRRQLLESPRPLVAVVLGSASGLLQTLPKMLSPR